MKDRNFSSKISAFPNKSRRKRGNISVLDYISMFTAIIKKGEKQFVALCPELDVVSQGYTVEESLANLKEAVELYIEEM